MSKLNIVICDDQETDHKIIEEKFISNTFLNDKVSITKLYYFENSPNNEINLIDYVKNNGSTIDFIFLDLQYDPENITNEDHHKVVSKTIDIITKNDYNCKVLIVSKDGANSSSNYFKVGDFEVPMISKSAKGKTINVFLQNYYQKWLEAKILELTYSELQVLRDILLSDEENMIINIANRVYNIECLFSHLNTKSEYYKATISIPDFSFKGWETLYSGNILYALPVKEYFKKLYANMHLQTELKDWDRKLINYLTAYLIGPNFLDCERIDDETDEIYYNTITNSIIATWKTKKCNNEHLFLEYLTRRRLIMFLYYVVELTSDEIYELMKDVADIELASNAVTKTFRSNYFIFEATSTGKKNFTQFYKNFTVDDRKIFKSIIKVVLKKVNEFDCQGEETAKSKIDQLKSKLKLL